VQAEDGAVLHGCSTAKTGTGMVCNSFVLAARREQAPRGCDFEFLRAAPS
jgi:hypothetical protein